jgi:hypothetical protein
MPDAPPLTAQTKNRLDEPVFFMSCRNEGAKSGPTKRTDEKKPAKFGGLNPYQRRHGGDRKKYIA